MPQSASNGILSVPFSDRADMLVTVLRASRDSRDKLVHGQAGVPDQAPQRALGNLPVVWDRQACGVPVSDQDDVVAASSHGPAECLKRPDNLLTTQDRQASHQAVTSTW